MTIKTKLSFWPFACLCLLGLCIILWFTRGCGSKPSPAITQNQQANDTVAKLLAVVQQSNIREGLLREDSIAKAKAIKDGDTKLAQTQNKLDQANKTATQLANDVVDAKTHLDTARYISACDSLAVVTKRYGRIKDSLKQVTQSALDARDAALKNANGIKSDLRQQILGYKSAFDLEKKQNEVLAKALNPKAKVYIGLEAWSCPAASGVGPGIMYQMKDEKIVGLSGGIATTGTWWVGAKAYIKIQLHK